MLSSEVTLVRVVFLGKTSPPFLTSRRPEAVYEIKKGGFFLCGTSIVCLLTRQRAEILYFGENVFPLSCALLSLRGFVLFVSGRSNDWC